VPSRSILSLSMQCPQPPLENKSLSVAMWCLDRHHTRFPSRSRGSWARTFAFDLVQIGDRLASNCVSLNSFMSHDLIGNTWGSHERPDRGSEVMALEADIIERRIAIE
jgi:hypothetical protein